MTREKLTLTNDFHNTSISLLVERRMSGKAWLSKSQVRKANRVLCGSTEYNCDCGGNELREHPHRHPCLGYDSTGNKILIQLED